MRFLALAPMAVLLVLAASCGGGGGGSASPPASQTFEAALDDAQQTPVEEPILAYASQLCSPIRNLFEDASGIIESFDALATTEPADGEAAFEAAIEAAIDALGELEAPIEAFLNDLEDVDPPAELAEFHASLIAEIEYGLDGLRALSEEGIFGAAALASPPPSAEEPEGFQAGLIQECGADLQEFVEEFGADFLSSDADPISFEDEPPSAPAPPATGALGDRVESGDFALVVHGVEDPYTAPPDEFQLPGYRWLTVEVSLTNVSDEEQYQWISDFTVQDIDGVDYLAYIEVNAALESGSLAPGETVRGKVGFEVPDLANIVRLGYDPDFGGHVFEIALQ